MLTLLLGLSHLIHLTSHGEDFPLEVQIPRTEREAQIGLSRHKSLQENEGMLFIHSNMDHHLFTMEKTSIPLLFLFFDENLELVEVQKGEPFQKELIAPSVACQYVLEAHPNLFKEQPQRFTSLKLEIKKKKLDE